MSGTNGNSPTEETAQPEAGRTSLVAVASLALGVFWYAYLAFIITFPDLMFGRPSVLLLACALVPILPIVTVFLGWRASVAILSSDGALKGRGLAAAGQALGGVELALLVAGAVIVAAPGFSRPKGPQGDSAGVGNLRTICGAQVNFHSVNGRYATTFDELADAVPPFLDGDWSHPKNGYSFVFKGDTEHFTASATPVGRRMEGARHFFVDESGVIRASSDGPADRNSRLYGEGSSKNGTHPSAASPRAETGSFRDRLLDKFKGHTT